MKFISFFPGSCKYASCSSQEWSTWVDVPSPVGGNASHCGFEQRTWLCTEKRDCDDVGSESCPPGEVENREKPVRKEVNKTWDSFAFKQKPFYYLTVQIRLKFQELFVFREKEHFLWRNSMYIKFSLVSMSKLTFGLSNFFVEIVVYILPH